MTKPRVEVYSKRRCPICGYYYYDESTDITEKCTCPNCKSRMRITIISKRQEPICQKY